MSQAPYPWQRSQWQQLNQRIDQHRLAHALLLHGPAGTGKHDFAEALARRLLCREPLDGSACGHCRGCQLTAAGTHPDLHRLQPEEPGKPIKVDAVREMIGHDGLTAQAGGYKVLIVHPADAMNKAAANGLLKTLEEPASSSLMLLVSSRPERLPATIRSRCQLMPFPLPDSATAQAWLGERAADGLLRLAGGAPLAALRLADSGVAGLAGPMLSEFAELLVGQRDPVALAADWNDEHLALRLSWLTGWALDLLRFKMAGKLPLSNSPGLQQDLQAMAEHIDLAKLNHCLDRMLQAPAQLQGQANALLLLESLLVEWAPAPNRRRTGS